MWDVKRRPVHVPSYRHPLALLVFATLGAIVAGLLLLSHVSQRRNEARADEERAGVAAAVRALHERAARDLARLSARPVPGVDQGDPGLLDEVLRVDVASPGSLTLIGGRGRGGSDLDHAVLDFVRPLLDGVASTAGGMIAPGDLFDATAIAVPDAGAGQGAGRPVSVLVGLRQVDAAYLAAIAKSSGVTRLELVYRASDGTARRGAWSDTEWRGFGLTWEPARPGDELMRRGTMIVMAGTSMIAVLIILRARRETGRLHDSEARAVEASRNDWLSGLPNRVFFNHVLERDLKALARGEGKLALFYIDVDRFKDINDSFGLEGGDLMIQAVTRRIEAVLADGQSLARFEGDAFSVLLPGIETREECERFAGRVQAAMAAPFHLGGTSVDLSLSMGIAIAPDDATERGELVRLANLALYRAKREGRNRFAFYQPDLHAEWRRRSSIETALPRAIAEGGLVLRYQPIVDGASGRMVCAEALVRWNHPAEGLIAPDDFIGLAEDRGLIVPLGEWVLREACAAARRWPEVRVAVNVSPIQFREKDFVERVTRIVEEAGLEPGRLELELTEGVLADHAGHALGAMAALRRLGIRLAMDDFGAGFSSLIYLRRFAFDKIKIDRAFIEGIEEGGEAAILLDSIVQLGRALNLTVTAEGVETARQRDIAARMGCHQLQGYLIARPLPEAEFMDFLNANRSATLTEPRAQAVA